ncbi:MAG TPA: serine/threonine protein kinase, partial [Polyangiales bacterium]|nr:serine/threonine protein kinase [Polyangiales bacterium]
MLTPGERIGDYEILGMLGAGGMGAVYSARDTRLGRPVAIKTLLPGMSLKRELVQRFEQEWRSTASIKSEHIPTVYTVGSLPNGTLWMAMEYLDGA